MSLSKKALQVGEQGERATAINKLLSVKGFEVDGSEALSGRAMSALTLIQPALRKSDIGIIDATTVSALIVLPATNNLSIFDLAPLLAPKINTSWGTVPAKVEILGAPCSLMKHFKKQIQFLTSSAKVNLF